MNSPWKDTFMFTGIIEELGTLESVQNRTAGARFKIRCSTVRTDMTEGASIAVNGVCLTAVDLEPNAFAADLAPETLQRTNLGDLRAGARVNLERPLSPSGRLSGHIVQGHVDGTGEFLALDSLGDENWWLRIRVPAELDAFLVYKGSIAIDGISLTIAALEADVLSVTIIPHTFKNTSLGAYRPGSRVNLECDILAKHVEKLLRKLDMKSPMTVEKLRENGF
jgi:riboflavin synthase